MPSPSPSASLATLRPDLGASLMEFSVEADLAGAIGLVVAPAIDVALQSDIFGRIPIEEMLQSPDTARAPGSAYRRGNWTFTTDSYACKEHGWEEPIDDRKRRMYQHFFDAEVIAAVRARGFVLRNFEQRVADLIFDPATWTGSSLTTAVDNEWDDVELATPIADVEAAVQAVYENSGVWPDTMIMSRQVFRNLRLTDDVKAAIASSGAGDPNRASKITTQMLSEVFDLPKIVVAGGTKNSANPGQAASLAPIWSNEYCMICKTADTQDIEEPCIARTFHWSEDGSQLGGTVEEYREEQRRSNIYRCRFDTDEKRMYTELGHLLSNITT